MMKKRVKKYQPKPVRVPGIIPLESVADVFPMKAFQLHAAIVTMIERPQTDHCNNLTRQLCIIAGGLSKARGGAPLRGSKDCAAVAVMSAIRVIEDIIDRIERTGKFLVTDTEAVSLRAAAGKLDEALHSIPLAAYRLAEREVTAREEDMVRVMEVAA